MPDTDSYRLDSIKRVTARLRRQYRAPEQLTQSFLDARMEELAGWHDSAAELAREADAKLSDAVEQLVGAMTPAEEHAARRLFATVYPLLCREAQKTHRRSAPPDHEVSPKEVIGLAWPVFLRCLATFDRSTSLTTWIVIDARSHFRGYLRRIRDRDDTETIRRARRKVLQTENRLLATEGRRPTRQEYAQAVRSAHAWFRSLQQSRLEDIIDYLTENDAPIRLDRPIGEDGDMTLHDRTPAPEPGRAPRPGRVGKRLAARLGKTGLWDRMTNAE